MNYDQAGTYYVNADTIDDGVYITASNIALSNAEDARIYGGVFFSADNGRLVNLAGAVIRSSPESDSYATLLVTGSNGSETIVNAGLLAGTVELNGGDDVFNEQSIRITTVDLGAGDDTYVFGNNSFVSQPSQIGQFRDGFVTGGSGYDTLQLNGLTTTADGLHVTGFERLQLRGVEDTLSNFNGFSSIDPAPGHGVNLYNSRNPDASVSLANVGLVLGVNSSLGTILGSAGTETMNIAFGSHFDTALLGDGSDTFQTAAATLSDQMGNPIGTVLDGGAGRDQLLLGTADATAAVEHYDLDFAKVRNFESVTIYANLPPPGGARYGADMTILNATGIVDLRLSSNGKYVVTGGDLSSTQVHIGSFSDLTIDRFAVVGGAYGPTAVPFEATRDDFGYVAVHNAGTIRNDVVLGGGDDGYDGGGVVLGTVYGLGGNDRLAGGANGDRLDGGDGADTLSPGRGSNVVEGGGGFDTLVLPGARADYSLLVSGDQTYLVGRGDADRVSGIESVRFADATVAWGDVTRTAAAFDPLRYIASSGDLRQAFGADAAKGTAHYLAYGFAEGRDAKAFDPLAYTASYGDLRAAFGTDAAAASRHYIQYGAAEKRAVSFDALRYVASYGDLRQAFGVDADAGAAHYIRYGAAEGRQTTFNPLFYTASYGDLIQSFGFDTTAATKHFIRYGAGEGRTTSFDPIAYAATNVDLARQYHADTFALTVDYIANGFAGHRPAAGFDAVGYLLTYGDLQQARLGSVGALRHWVTNGVDENRIGDTAFGREQASHALPTGQTVRAGFEQAFDHDWFVFGGGAGRHADIAYTGEVAARLELHASDGRLVQTLTGGGGGATVHFDTVLPANDYYYVSLGAASPYDHGTYSLGLTFG